MNPNFATFVKSCTLSFLRKNNQLQKLSTYHKLRTFFANLNLQLLLESFRCRLFQLPEKLQGLPSELFANSRKSPTPTPTPTPFRAKPPLASTRPTRQATRQGKAKPPSKRLARGHPLGEQKGRAGHNSAGLSVRV